MLHWVLLGLAVLAVLYVAIDIRRGPKKAQQLAEQRERLEQEAALPAPADPRRALVVDADEARRAMLADVLEEEGYSVASAGDAGNALFRLGELAALSPDVLLLVDCRLPDLDATQFARSVHSNGRFEAVRMIFMAPDPELEAVRPALRADRDDCLARPFTTEALRDKVRWP